MAETQQEQNSHPLHLDPSELGTKEYWDRYYENDLENESGEDFDEGDESNLQAPDPSELESWFDDVGAPQKTLAFLTSDSFPLSPQYTRSGGDSISNSTVLDLGTGNGSALFALRLQGGYAGRMVGVDYSSRSIELARRLRGQYVSSAALAVDDACDLEFEVLDIIHDDPRSQSWWPTSNAESESNSGFDLVLDKGTFDAISLSSATVTDSTDSSERRICELYPSKVLAMVKKGGFLLVTSCNWTENEVVAWFTKGEVEQAASGGRFEVYDTIKYAVFEFGGQKGQGVASVCFRKVER